MDKDLERCHLTKQILNEYSEETTIHGIHYLVDSNRSKCEKFYWAVMCFASITACSVLIRNVVIKSRQTPVIVTFGDQTIPVYEIPLPAITICPQNKFRRNITNVTKILNQTIENNCLNGTDCSIQYDVVTQICPRTYGMGYANSVERIWYDIDYWIKQLAPDLLDSIKFCQMFYAYASCDALFREVYTSSGVCYTFNGLYPEDLYRQGVVYLPYNHSALPNSTWSLENGYKSAQESVYPFNSLGGTFQSSIEFVLNQYHHDIEPNCDLFQGFKILIHAPDDVPIMKEDYIKLPLISDARFSIEPKYIKTTSELQKYPPEKRGCFFNHERYLKYFKIYTENNCWLECLTNHTLDKCQCAFFFMPRYAQTPICGISKLFCLQLAINDVIRQSTDQLNNIGVQCNCMPSCTSISYNVDVTNAIVNISMINDYLKVFNLNSEISHMNPSVLTIFFKSTHFIPIQRSESFSKTDLVASCGGILGLFMGFSLISMAELLYYCAIRPFCMIYQCQKQKAKIIDKKSVSVHNKVKTIEWNQLMYVSEISNYGNRSKRSVPKIDNVIAYFD